MIKTFMVLSSMLICFFICLSDCKNLSCLAVLHSESMVQRIERVHYLRGPIVGKPYKANKLDGAKKAPHL